ncbi:MAG: HEAT repeat domain-containing protein [Isosphaeraceae bacterium]
MVGTGATLLLNKAISSPPPPQPVYVAPAPVVVGPAPVVVAPAPPPAVVVNPPVRYIQAPQQTIVVDPVAQAIGRLSSNHDNSRKEGAVVLGRLGDARAVPALINVLKTDRNKDVRIAAATALGQIGDPRGAIVLERAIVYDKKQEVRDAAAAALASMPRPAPSASLEVAPGTPVAQAYPNTNAASGSVPLEPAEAVPPPPSPAPAFRSPRN